MKGERGSFKKGKERKGKGSISLMKERERETAVICKVGFVL